MKKIVAISLLLMIFINQLGYYLLHSVQQYQARCEIKRTLLASLPESELTMIPAGDELEWEEEGREFSFKDEMYDVVNMKVLHGKTFYYCINDTKEKQLLDQLVKVVKSSRDDDQRNSGKNVIKFQLMDSELPGAETLVPTACAKRQYDLFTPPLAFSHNEVLPHPPKRS